MEDKQESMTRNNSFKFKVGETTKNIWSGDIVTECEFVADLGRGQMLFYDKTFKCFRKTFVEVDDDGKPYLNGWDCADRPSKLV